MTDETRALALDPTLSKAWAARGQAYRTEGKYDLAIADEDKALELDPGRVQAAFLFKGERDRAIHDLDQAIALEPKLGLAFMTRGLAREKRGERAGAKADLVRARELGETDRSIGQALERLAKRER